MAEWEFEKEDIEFLHDVSRMELSMVAQKWAKKKNWRPQKMEANTRAWLYRIRSRISRCQNYVNQIRALQKNPRIRKLTTSGQLNSPGPENEESE